MLMGKGRMIEADTILAGFDPGVEDGGVFTSSGNDGNRCVAAG